MPASITQVVFFIIFSKYDYCQIVNMDPGSLWEIQSNLFSTLYRCEFSIKIISLYFATNCKLYYLIYLLKVCDNIYVTEARAKSS